MPTRNINLTEHYDQFVEEQVEAGRYKNASEVLGAGLQLLEQQTQTEDQKLKVLEKLAAEGFHGLDQGQGLVITTESDLRSTVTKIGRVLHDRMDLALHLPTGYQDSSQESNG